MRLASLALLAATLLSAPLLPGCQTESADSVDASYETIAYETQQEAAPSADLSQTPTATASRRAPVLLRRAELAMRVDAYDEAAAAVPTVVAQYDAYLAGERETRSDRRVSNTYTIRVASAQFDALVNALTDLAAEVDGRTVTVDDVTEEFVDLEARLRARRAVEDQYVALLGRAGKVDEVIAVQRQLAQVREEIERAEGRMRYLTDRAAMSTVQVTLYETMPVSIAGGPSFLHDLSGAFGAGWSTLLALIVGLVAVWPLWLVLGIGAYVLRRGRRARYASDTTPSAAG